MWGPLRNMLTIAYNQQIDAYPCEGSRFGPLVPGAIGTLFTITDVFFGTKKESSL